jgi:hypothetical protein
VIVPPDEEARLWTLDPPAGSYALVATFQVEPASQPSSGPWSITCTIARGASIVDTQTFATNDVAAIGPVVVTRTIDGDGTPLQATCTAAGTHVAVAADAVAIAIAP